MPRAPLFRRSRTSTYRLVARGKSTCERPLAPAGFLNSIHASTEQAPLQEILLL